MFIRIYILLIIVFSARMMTAAPVTITRSVLGNGLILGTGTYEIGARVTLRAVPQVDWKFDHWEGVENSIKDQAIIDLQAYPGMQPKAIFSRSAGFGRFKGGTVVAWGSNSLGQTNVPKIATNVIQISAGYKFSLALLNDGSVIGWGNNQYGKSTIPPSLLEVFSISAGQNHSVAIQTNGIAVPWGDLGFGVYLVTNVAAVKAGNRYTLYLKSDGTIMETGPGPTGFHKSLLDNHDFISVDAGFSHGLALRSNGTLVRWGDSWAAIAGGFPSSIGGFRSIAAGLHHSIALKWNGEVVTWGGSPTQSTEFPINATNLVAIAAGSYHSLGVRSDGTVVKWGFNTYSFANSEDLIGKTPIPHGLSNVIAVSAGFDHNVAIQYSGVGVKVDPPKKLILEEGSNLNISANICGICKKQWFRNGVAIENQSAETMIVNKVSLTDSGQYCLVAVNSSNGVVTDSTELKVLPIGSPRVFINGKEIDGVYRAGGLAKIEISTSFPRGQILYTIDGSEPNFESKIYSGPFVLTKGAILRAVALSEDFGSMVKNTLVSIQVVPTFELNTSVNFGSGSVEKLPNYQRYLLDDVVTVRAVARDGFRFVRWEGDLSGSFSNRNIVMNRGKVVRAVFEAIPRYQLIGVAPAGTVSGTGEYFQGSRVDLTATPTTNWVFLNWAGDYAGTNSQFSWAVDGPATFQAVFGTAITSATTGAGRVMLEPDLPVYPYGSPVKVTPLPSSGNYLALWGGAGVGQPRTQWILRVTNGAPKITALFQPLSTDRVVLTAQSTFGGRISQPASDGIYTKAASVTVNAVPDSGYEFQGWSGDASGVVNPLTLTLDGSKNVRAEFRRTGVVSYPATITVGGPGIVRLVPDLGEYESGTEVDLVAEPSSGAVFSGWQGAVSSSQKRIRVTVNGPIKLTAGFKSIYPVATEARGEGQVLLSPPDANYVEGTSVALTAKPAEGWGFVQWSGDLSTTAQESALTVDAPKRVVAEFARLGTLTLKNIGQGTVTKAPEGSSFLPGTSVRLNATPAPGWKFIRWSGGATGTNPELAVVVGRTEAIVAEFADGESPKVTVAEPVSGTVRDERFALKGSASDNLRLASVSWTWNGVPQGAVPMGDGVFSIEGLTLQPGTNQIELEAVDAVGNATRVERMVVWTPVRSLLVKTAIEVQEGQRLVFPLTLDSPGDVAGLTFQLSYDPVWLADPQLEWGALVGRSVNTLNTATNGQVWATFSMPGQTLPAGVQSIANVSFRARSVPELREVELKPSIRSVSGLQGNALSLGNAALAGKGRIKPRRLKADNNANQRLDIGDAVVVARLQVGLEETRGWDVTLNDLNSSGSLDNGDVVKVLRAVVGLDPQPSPGSEGKRLASALGLAKVLVNTNDAMAIELLDGPKATVGQPYRVAVKLNRLKGTLSGLSFALKYPASLTLTDKQVGALVPGDALPFWNESAGQVSLAAIRSTAWANATGVAAVLTFVPSAGFSAQAEWPLKLEQVEITGSGFDVRPVEPVSVAIQSTGGTLNTPPQIALQPPGADGSLTLEIRAPQGATVALEATGDLNTWIEAQRITGQGDSTPVKVTLKPDPTVQAKFWRLRVR